MERSEFENIVLAAFRMSIADRISISKELAADISAI